LVALDHWGEQGLEALAGAMEADFDGVLFEVEERRDFGDGPIFEIVEHDDFAVARGELLDGAADVSVGVIGKCGRVGGGNGRRGAMRGAAEGSPAGEERSSVGAAFVESDDGEPGGEGGFAAEAAALSEGGKENFLDHIIHIRRPAKQAINEAGDARPMELHHLFKRRGVAFGKSLGEALIVQHHWASDECEGLCSGRH